MTEQSTEAGRVVACYRRRDMNFDRPVADADDWIAHHADNKRGWAVAVVVICSTECRFASKRLFLPTTFSRKRDAELAAAAIRQIIDWSGELEEVARRIIEFGPRKIQQTMMEALQW